MDDAAKWATPTHPLNANQTTILYYKTRAQPLIQLNGIAIVETVK